METYLVGGAVRDKLLNQTVTERDWVVLGQTPEAMQALGFQAVGKDFPVFLHPKTKEEYALARTERKTAKGYRGFSVYAATDVTLKQDLLRRDLTINAIAMSEKGDIIDPYGGVADLEKRIFRHVSPAFAEDPVRILRLARFAARYAPLGFTIAKQTRELMHDMVNAGEVDALVPERIWAEMHKALGESKPSAFFYTLRDCGAMAKIFPEIDALFGIEQPAKYHPEIDCGVHTMMVLDRSVTLTDKLEARFAALVHDLGKALSPKNDLPHHHGHELKGVALHVTEYHTHCHRVNELRATTLVDLLQTLGAFKEQNRLQEFVIACESDMRGRLTFENAPYPQAEMLLQLASAAANIDTSTVLNRGLQGAKIGEAIRRLRIQAIAEYRLSNQI